MSILASEKQDFGLIVYRVDYIVLYCIVFFYMHYVLFSIRDSARGFPFSGTSPSRGSAASLIG